MLKKTFDVILYPSASTSSTIKSCGSKYKFSFTLPNKNHCAREL